MKQAQADLDNYRTKNTNKLGFILLGISCLDVTATTLGIHFSYFYEVNPLLNYFLQQFGLRGLICSKMFFVIIPILIFEIVSKFELAPQNEIRFIYRITIVIYIVVLVTGFIVEFLTAH